MTELPFRLRGKIFRSAMPFCVYDEKRTLFAQFQRSQISVVLVLAGRKECLERTGIDLIDFYQRVRLAGNPPADTGLRGSP